jgi:acetyl esterase/lipase
MLVNTRVNVVPGEPQDSLCADDLEVDKEEKSPTTTKPSVVSDETRRKSLDERASALGIDMSTKSVRPPQILRRQSRSDPIMAFDSGFVNGEPTDAVTSSQQLSSPRGKKVLPVLFHIHGGGFISGSPSTHEVYLREWAKATDAIIFAVDYTKVCNI